MWFERVNVSTWSCDSSKIRRTKYSLLTVSWSAARFGNYKDCIYASRLRSSRFGEWIIPMWHMYNVRTGCRLRNLPCQSTPIQLLEFKIWRKLPWLPSRNRFCQIQYNRFEVDSISYSQWEWRPLRLECNNMCISVVWHWERYTPTSIWMMTIR